MATTWAEVFLGITGVCLAFLVPFVVFMVMIVGMKIKPTPLLVAAGLGVVVFVAVLILLPMDPRSRQYSWYYIVAIALSLGLLGFLLPFVTYLLQSRLGNLSDADALVKGFQSQPSGTRKKPHGNKDGNHIAKIPAEDKGQDRSVSQ